MGPDRMETLTQPPAHFPHSDDKIHLAVRRQSFWLAGLYVRGRLR